MIGAVCAGGLVRGELCARGELWRAIDYSGSSSTRPRDAVLRRQLILQHCQAERRPRSAGQSSNSFLPYDAPPQTQFLPPTGSCCGLTDLPVAEQLLLMMMMIRLLPAIAACCCFCLYYRYSFSCFAIAAAFLPLPSLLLFFLCYCCCFSSFAIAAARVSSLVGCPFGQQV